MRKFRLIFGVLAAVLLAVAPQMGWAQSNVATGQIFGTCADPDGAMMPGVIIQVKNNATGFNRGTVSDATGFFRLDLLPSGTYDVRGDMSGFKSEIRRGVVVTLGSSVKVEFKLALSAVEEEIVVTAESPVIETTNASVSAAISDTQIANLPLSGRDFTDFVVLTPGAIADDVDQTAHGRGGINIGARGIQNSFNIDGTGNQSSFFGEERGGTRPPFTFSQAAIKEMQVIRNSYNLQFSAGGGVINAITKSGTNQFHGQVFGYYTDDSMRSTDALGRDSDSFEQIQYGLALGGAIVKDKFHFFVGADTQDFSEPQLHGFDEFDDSMIAPWESITGLDYDQEVGDIGATNDALVFMVKFDWQISNNHLLTLRDNWSTQEGLNLTSNSFTNGWSTNGIEENSFNSLVLTLNSVLSENVFNEAYFQYALEERPRSANVDTIPEAAVGAWPNSYATFGQNQFLPNFLDEKRFQFIDNVTFYSGNHSFKAGVNIDLVNFDDGFYRYGGGAYSYDGWDEFFADTPFSFTQAFSPTDGTVKFDSKYYALYAQDDWRTSPNFTLTYGLRYQVGKHQKPFETNPLYPDTGQIPNDGNNWAPRVGFAWDINGDGKSVLRGGGGIFYDWTPTLLDANALLANGIRVVRVSQRCSRDDCPEYPNIYGGIGDLPEAGGVDIFVFDPAFEDPETLRFSLGYEREIARDLSVGADVIWAKGTNLERKWDQNIAQVDGTTPDGRPLYCYECVYDEFDQIMQFTSDAESEYKAFVLLIHKRFSGRWLLDASYTWSDSKDNDSNERSVSSSSAFPQDQFDPRKWDWGPSGFDITHKFVASFAYQLPANFMVSAIGSYRSGFPYSAGDSRDNNHDSYRNERAMIEENGTAYQVGRNTYNQPSDKNLDLRLSWTAVFGQGLSLELIFDAFNVTNEASWWTSNFGLVNSDGSLNPTFGDLNRVGDPRHYQFGARFQF